MSEEDGGFWGKFFRRKDNVANPYENSVEAARQLGAYKRLREKYSGTDAQEVGFTENNLTIGDLVDIIHLYKVAAIGTIDLAPVVSIINLLYPNTEVNQEEIGKLLNSKVQEIDRSDQLYRFAADPGKMMDGEVRVNDLCHYPDGLIIARENSRPGLKSEDRKYMLRFTRRSGDTGSIEYVKPLFEDIGLPVLDS